MDTRNVGYLAPNQWQSEAIWSSISFSHHTGLTACKSAGQQSKVKHVESQRHTRNLMSPSLLHVTRVSLNRGVGGCASRGS